MLDRVLEVPSPWLMSIFPVVMWLTLHRDDGLVQFIFDKYRQLKVELSRVHALISKYCIEQGIGVQPKNHKKAEKQEELHLILVELMGNSLLFEENFLIGFLPLRSYFDQNKQIGPGKQCPAEKQNLVRCLLLRDALE